ncbi:MAG: hypothetical protein IJO62_03935 [Clostridia bacterium]|nr:hypothetical protein [Clostridia bacterium]
MNTIKVADLRIRVKSSNTDFFEKLFSNYICNDGLPLDMSMETVVFEKLSQPNGEIIQALDTYFVIKTAENKNCFYKKDSPNGEILFAVFYTTDYRDVRIEIKRDINFLSTNACDFEYIFTGFMFSNRLAFLGGTVLHSSAIAYENKGIVFTAPSGTGKSTHTELWHKKFSDMVVTLNDDKPAIRFIDGEPYLYGTPWSGKTHINSNICVPLSAIVCLERDTECSIERMDAVSSVLFLTKQLPNPYHDSDIGKKTVGIINELFNAVPIFKLKCNISENAVDTVFNAVLGDNL